MSAAGIIGDMDAQLTVGAKAWAAYSSGCAVRLNTLYYSASLDTYA